MIQLIPTEGQTERFSHYPVYQTEDLGLIYSPERSSFRIWSPVAEAMQLLLYDEGVGGTARLIVDMERDRNGSWSISLQGDWNGMFYAFRARINDQWCNELPDPYVKCVGINGKRGMIADLDFTNPPGWDTDKSPSFINKTDAIIYELHIRDASISFSSGIFNKGKFIGLTETGTSNHEGLSTGLDHLKEMGVTHVHLLPFHDFYSVDEAGLGPQYSWGYEPLHYNVPEGSYSTNPYDGPARIRELKQMILTLHQNGLRVIMDVTYNHTVDLKQSSFEQFVPGYFYRHNEDGTLSNASACGNETASERAMMRKFMLDSVLYWTKEYHIDGFRFDLMGIHDITTMNLISRELHKLRSDILLYGEGWAPGPSPLPESMRAMKAAAIHLDKIAVFSDDIRDAIKGNVFAHTDKGFASGAAGFEESIKFGVVASCPHPQINYEKIIYSKGPYAGQPWQTINYADCHDNHILWDKLAISAEEASEEERIEMQKLALSIVLTSQGIPFLHAGSEFLRSKQRNANSYNAGDGINAINWELKTKYAAVNDYIKGLISMRKRHPAFRMKTAEQIQQNIRFEENLPDGVIVYTIDGAAMRDEWRKIRVFYNGNNSEQQLSPDSLKWRVAVENNRVVNGESVQGLILLKPFSCTVLYLEIPV